MVMSNKENYGVINIYASGSQNIIIESIEGERYDERNFFDDLVYFGNLIRVEETPIDKSILFQFEHYAIVIYGELALKIFLSKLKSDPILYRTYNEKFKQFFISEEKKALNNTNKKLKRMNKYVKRRLVAGALAVGTLVFTIGAVNSKNTQEKDSAISYSNENIDDNTPTDDIIYEETNQNIPVIANDSFDLVYSNPEKLICINYDCVTNILELDKAQNCKNNYYSLIEKYSNMYGVDSNIMLGIATQERGTHSEIRDSGGAIGLMQLEVGVWDGAQVRAFNYETNSYDEFDMTEQSMAVLENNIKYACMIFQNCMMYMNDNVVASIQCYNYGYNNMIKIFNSYQYSTGITMEQALSNVNCVDWLEHRDVVDVGDSRYVENVLRWLDKVNTFNLKSTNGGNIECVIGEKENVISLT